MAERCVSQGLYPRVVGMHVNLLFGVGRGDVHNGVIPDQQCAALTSSMINIAPRCSPQGAQTASPA